MNIQILNSLKDTQFEKVFTNNTANLPAQLFADSKWEVLGFDMKSSRVYSSNFYYFSKKFDALFEKTSDYIYLAPCLDLDVELDYGVIKYSSQIKITEFPYLLPQTTRQTIFNNWCNDFFWGTSLNWGLYHYPDARLLLLGYDKSIHNIINSVFIGANNIIGQKKLFKEIQLGSMKKNEQNILRIYPLITLGSQI